MVLSNYAPPQGSNVIKKETLPKSQTSRSWSPNSVRTSSAVDNRLSSLERSVGELAENLRAQSEVITNVPEGYGDTNIAVSVVQGPAIVARPPHKNFNHPGNLRRNLPKAQPRPAVPAARSGGGGRAG